MDFQKLERVRIALALVAAVITGGAALYGVYVKGRAEARRETAASYETLAPAVNELREAVRQLQQAQGVRPPDAERDTPAASRNETSAAGRSAGTQARTPAPRRRPAATAPARPASEPSSAEPAPAGEPAKETPAPTAEPAEPTSAPGPAKKVPIDFDKAWEVYQEIRKRRER